MCQCQTPKTCSWPVGWIGADAEGRMANYPTNGLGSWMRLDLAGLLAKESFGYDILCYWLCWLRQKKYKMQLIAIRRRAI